MLAAITSITRSCWMLPFYNNHANNQQGPRASVTSQLIVRLLVSSHAQLLLHAYLLETTKDFQATRTCECPQLRLQLVGALTTADASAY
mmetsp:Transcript_20871/g.62403  ORF Transcript_20871/g.62403 Transcript_20871/m.62403 type:complete len:89 (-) Transcript_20871:724-990(-)